MIYTENRRHIIIASGFALVALILAWKLWPAESIETEQVDSRLPVARVVAESAEAGGQSSINSSPAKKRMQELALWQDRHHESTQLYEQYQAATRYPHESRPIAEAHDQIRPFDAVGESRPLRDRAGKAIKGLQLSVSQDRVFIGARDSANLSLTVRDDQGQPVALSVRSGVALGVRQSAAQTPPRADVAFTDDGAGPDARASDGVYSARFTPATAGFGDFAGDIQIVVEVVANGEQAVAAFALVYEPSTPAEWLGVREALEEGGLNFYLKAQVARAGQYIVSARVYDAKGKPFALLRFNEDVSAGAQEFKLQLFGALIHDQKPEFPLRLMDVEGFVLKPNASPDRAMLAPRPGLVHTSGRYAMQSFSAAEWSSEERTRYLTEYAKDVQEAQDQIKALQGN